MRLSARLRMIRNMAIHRRKRLANVASSAFIHPRADVSTDLRADAYAFVAPFCKLDPGVTIGRYSMLARHVAVVGDDHRFDVPGVPMQFSGRPEQTATTIEDDVWIGYGALIRRGVRIGRGAVVGAHAVVTKDVASFSIVTGMPARVIAERFPDPEERAKHEAVLDGPVLAPSFAPRLADLPPTITRER